MSDFKTLDPVYLIGHEQIRKIAYARARRNNTEAKLVGQPAELTASALIDLYYRMNGRCAISGFPLEYHENSTHPRSIELDHIVECRRRGNLSAAISGNKFQSGMIAQTDNVQWVCRFANIMKEQANRQKISLVEMCRAIAEQGENGYPLRSQASFLGFSGRADYRAKVITECIRDNPVCPVSLVVQKLSGTIGDAAEPVVREHMRELGWTDSRPTYVQMRRDAIAAVTEAHGHHWDTVSDFQLAVRQELEKQGVEKSPAAQWLRKQARSMGIQLIFGASMRSVCAGDKAQVLSVLKSTAESGMDRHLLVQTLASCGMDVVIAERTIECLIDFGAIYGRNSGQIVVASMTREQAASKIGVSANRLKKWASENWDGKDAGPPYMKSKSKSLTFYKYEDVEEFIQRRGRHRLDLSVSGQRNLCVIGGRKGGRPQSPSPCGSSQKTLFSSPR